MDYITVREAAEKWGVSPRSITYHLVAGRIEGAVRKGHMWLIPATSPKPQDRRRKKDPLLLHTFRARRFPFSILDLFPFQWRYFLLMANARL